MTRIGSIGDTRIIDWDVKASIYVSLALLKFNCKTVANYFYSYTKYNNFRKEILRKSLLNAVPQKINLGDIEKVNIIIPENNVEQQKIAHILSTWDNAIELKENLLEMKEEQKKGLMQSLLTGKIRLPGFKGEWEKRTFDKVFSRVPSKKYQIKSNDYLDDGLYPIVDQGKQKVIGYSNQGEKLFHPKSDGVIIFGDHTRELKFIDFDFIIGADGTQLLITNEGFDLKFYYYNLLIKKIPNTGYNRHFKFIKELVFFCPPLSEQKAIANILSTTDKEIELLSNEIDMLKEQKRGLMQLLLTGIVRVQV